MTPARGEVWLFDLGMEGKVRPALIVSVGYGDLDRAREVECQVSASHGKLALENLCPFASSNSVHAENPAKACALER